MTTATGAERAVVEELLKLEEERCRALSEQDWPAFEAILSEDYTHVHMPGRIEEKAAYIAGQKERPRKTERRDLNGSGRAGQLPCWRHAPTA